MTNSNTPESAEAVQQWFLDSNDIPISLLYEMLGRITSRGIDWADIYFQHTRTESWTIEEGIIKSGSYSIEQGVGVRAVSGEKSALAYSDNITPAAIKCAADAVRAINSQGQILCHRRSCMKTIKGHELYIPKNPQISLEDAQKIQLLQNIEKYAANLDSSVTRVTANLASSYSFILVTRADGQMGIDIRPLVRFSIQVMVTRQNRRETATSGGGGRFLLSDLTDEMLQAWAKKAYHEATQNLDARPAPAGQMTVVLGAGWPAVLLHEAIGHGLEGDFNRKKLSAFTNKIGQQVAAPGITIVDNGTLERRRGSLNIDDEGTPTQETCLIKDGILVNYLQDITNARLMGMKTTGNGRRQSYAHLPMPRMTNTYMLNGTYDPQEIIESVEDGLYMPNFSGGQVDITNGKFVFSASETYRIEKGKITYPVREATLIGNGPDVLTRVSMIGNDLKLDSGVGTCGKDGQSVPVGVGQPTLRADSITVGGTD